MSTNSIVAKYGRSFVLMIALITVVVYWLYSSGFLGSSQNCPSSYYLFNNTKKSEAFMVDEDGGIVQDWSIDRVDEESWHHVALTSRGFLIAITEDQDVQLLDKHSRVIWTVPGRFHHDVFQLPDDSFAAIERVSEIRELGGKDLPVLVDYLVHISQDGQVLRRVDLLEPVMGLIPDKSIRRLKSDKKTKPHFDLISNSAADILHVNSIQAIGSAESGSLLPRQWLISYTAIDTIAFLDIKDRKITWQYGKGALERPHSPRYYPDSNSILVFDNGKYRKSTRVLEISKRSKEIIKSYPNGKWKMNFTHSRGSVQRICNNEVLIGAVDYKFSLEVSHSGALLRKINWLKWYRNVRKRKASLRDFKLYRVQKVPL